MKRFKRVMAVALSISMLAGIAGCGKEVAPLTPTTVSGSVEESVSESAPEATVEAVKRIDDNGKPIYDFDEFVNKEWSEAQKSAGYTSAYPQDAMRKVIGDRVFEILNDTDISALSPEDDLYKAITVYRQIVDREENDAKIQAIKKYLSKIDKVKNLKDIYALLGDEKYFCCNLLLNFYVDADDGGYNRLYFRTKSIGPVYDRLLSLLEQDENSEEMDGVLIRMKDLGYSGARIKEILENSKKVDGYINDYLNSPQNDGRFHNFNPTLMENRGVTVPMLDILRDLGILGENEGFVALNACDDFLNSLFTQENVPAVRDYLIFTSALTFSMISDYDRSVSMPDEYYTLTARQILLTYAHDVLLEEYEKCYIKDSTVSEVAALLEEVKKGAIDVVCNSEWLSTHGKELARRKILKMRDTVGKNTATKNLSDIVMSDNVVENYISLVVSQKRFEYSQLSKEDEARAFFAKDMFDVNARYLYQLNAFYICSGLLSEYSEGNLDSYEEILGHAGRIMAHEISHAYGPLGIDYDSNGWYEPWLTGEEQAEYDKELQAIADFFDGKEDEYGRTISGRQIANEAYSDILSIKICLYLLSQKENVDYDKFFRTCAKNLTMYYTEAGTDIPPENGYLPGKMRVNYVLGQFDKFYEIYDIDESSPFFVPEDKRIDIFK